MSRATETIAPPNLSCHVWITVIITWFPIIVTEWLKRPLNGLEALDTMRVNWVMMSVIHTCHPEPLSEAKGSG